MAAKADNSKAQKAVSDDPPKDEGKDSKSAESPEAADASEAKASEAPTEDVSAPAQKEQAPAAEEPRFAELIPPRALPKTKASASAPPPGLAPPGDSRSFRRMHEGKEEFCLLYRFHRQLIVRRGPVGNYGEVEVIDYPSEKSAAHAYANLCSDFSEEGFYDLRG